MKKHAEDVLPTRKSIQNARHDAARFLVAQLLLSAREIAEVVAFKHCEANGITEMECELAIGDLLDAGVAHSSVVSNGAGFLPSLVLGSV
jgi:hypothetical protein